MSIRDELREEIAQIVTADGEDIEIIKEQWQGRHKFFRQRMRGIADQILSIPALDALLTLANQAEQEGFEVVVVDNQASGLSKYGEDTPLMCNDITECPKTGWRKVVR